MIEKEMKMEMSPYIRRRVVFPLAPSLTPWKDGGKNDHSGRRLGSRHESENQCLHCRSNSTSSNRELAHQ
jgi:hypothetical protein